jgi:hypothetical protein
MEGIGVPSGDRLASRLNGRNIARNVYVIKLVRLIFVSLLLVLFSVASYATYRHWRALPRLPKLSLRPERLPAPLPVADLLRIGIRWVEMEATPASGLPGKKTLYRNTVESPGTLILRFQAEPRVVVGRQSHRGVLYTLQKEGTKLGLPDRLKRDLADSGITPAQRFSVLSVGDSPWPVLMPAVKERLAIASGLLISAFLLIHLLRAVASLFRPVSAAGTPSYDAGPRRLVQLAAALAVCGLGWIVFRSLRSHPVLPLESLLLFGLSAAFGLVLTIRFRRHRDVPAPVLQP